MSSQVRGLLASGFGQLRHEPTAKRIQAVLGGETVVDSTRAVLVWEPRRIVPSYAVPVEDVRGELVPVGLAADGPGDEAGVALGDVTALRLLDPRVPFTMHSAAGEAVDVHAAGQVRPGAGFRPADPDLAGLYFAVQASYEQQIVNANQQALNTAVQQYKAAYATELKKLPALLKTAKANAFPKALATSKG